MADQEREVLINRLTQTLPYPREWFEDKTTAQLIRIYNRPCKNKKHHAAILIQKEPIDAVYRKYDDESGQWMVKTDGHGWEPESN